MKFVVDRWGVLGVILLLTVGLSGCLVRSDRAFDAPSSLRVQTPRPDATLTSPVEIRGVARGPWYFEGQFSVRLLDSEGAVLGRTRLTAQSDWTTSDFVPFHGRLQFSRTGTVKKGRLVFEAANPSGLARNDKRAVLPVRLDE